MNSQMKRIVALAGMVAALVIVSSDAAFALGKSKKSGYRGWSEKTTSTTESNQGGGSNNVVTESPKTNDANPVPEPASMLLLGSALAGVGGYRKLKKRFTSKA